MNAAVAVRLDDLSLPRRVSVAHLLWTACQTARELGRLYTAFAGRTALAPLRAALAELARAKAVEVPALESFVVAASALREEAVPRVPAVRETGNGRLEDFGNAFRGEQALAAAYREVLALVGDPARLPGLADLAAKQRHHQVRLRDLYRQYS